MKTKCVYCKESMDNQDRFCSVCGSDNKPWVCPDCGTHHRSGFPSKCPNCGREISLSELITKDGKTYSHVPIYSFPETSVGIRVLNPVFTRIKNAIKAGNEPGKQETISYLKKLFIQLYDKNNLFLDPKGVDWDKLFDLCVDLYLDNNISYSFQSKKIENTLDQGSEIKKIWKKWEHLEIPLQLKNKSIEVAKPFTELVFMFLELNMKENVIAREDSQELGELVGSTVGEVIRSSFLIGYEFANKNPRKIYTESEMIEFTKQAYPLLNQGSKSANDLIETLIRSLLMNGKYDKSEEKILTDKSAILLQKIQSQCFSLGFSYLKGVQHNKGGVNMLTFDEWPGNPPKRCGICRKKVKKTLVFGDTKKGDRNVVMCERCYKKIGVEVASYGKSRRYAKIAGLWVSGREPDWHPNEIPDGTMIVINHQFSKKRTKLEYRKSHLGR